MQLTFRHDLAFVTATLTYSGVSIEIANMVVDIGAATTVINDDLAAEAGVYVSPTDSLAAGADRVTGLGQCRSMIWRAIGVLMGDVVE